MKKIVIVGNSGEALGSKKGPLVDNCDIVIRMNDFVTKGYENDLGSKTDIIACAFSSLNKICDPQKYPEYYHHGLVKKVDFWSARKLEGDRARRCYNLLGRMDIPQPTTEQWSRAIKGAYSGFWRKQLSTGLATIEMAVDFFSDSQIFIHAFDNKKEKTHYFDKEYLDKDYPGDPCGHNWLGEWEYINSYIKLGKLNVL